MKKATRQSTKEHNRDLVLKLLFDHDTISRAEIARITGLTRTTVSDVIANQIAEGLVEEVGVGASIGGKNPILLSLVADSRYLIGLNLAHDQFCGAIVNLRGDVKDMVCHPVPGRNREHALASVYEILDALVAKPWKPLVGIGIGTPGLVNTREGMVVSAVNLDWKDLPLAHLLEERYRLPVYVLNDSQAAAIGEYVYGLGGQSSGHLIVINVGHGIGAGILINGRLFQGDGGGAGEIGHVVVQEDGQLCRCGKRGCLETLASARAVVQRYGALVPVTGTPDQTDGSDPVTLDALVDAFRRGDPVATQVVIEAGRSLGSAVASLVGTLNIHKIILTGEMTRFGQPWLEAVSGRMRQAALSKMAEDTRVEVGALDVRGCILGASASMLLDSFSLLYNQP
jgi:predicted NBD/HSP70 family sugar kinase